MTFGDVLRQLLEERNVSQRQVAEDMNIAPSTLGNYIRGIREPDYETLKSIANYFNVSIDYLLHFQPNQNINDSEADLLQLYRSLNKTQQALYLEQGKAFKRVMKNN